MSHVVPDVPIKINFTNLENEGHVSVLHWNTMLKIVADVSIQVDGRRWYSEPMFPVVELAVQLFSWLEQPATDRPDLIYTSMESETEGLLGFHRRGNTWSVSAAYEEFRVDRPMDLEEIDRSCRDYLDALHRSLKDLYGLDMRAFAEQEASG